MVILIPLNIIIPIALVIVMLIFIFYFLYNKNKKIGGILIEEHKKLAKYNQILQDLKSSSQSPKKAFDILNKSSRQFFKEYFALDTSLTYLELETEFKKQNKEDYAGFCKKISDLKYRGKEKKPEEVRELVEIFSNLVHEQE